MQFYLNLFLNNSQNLEKNNMILTNLLKIT